MKPNPPRAGGCTGGWRVFLAATGPEYAYGSFPLGRIRIPRAGRYTVTMHHAATTGHNLMYLQSLDLTPEI
jgi:hypothetical protein